jgi:hypothetical protein
MLEIALGLPIFFGGILLILWQGYMYEASISLKAAVSNGVSAGVTRGDRPLVAVSRIGGIDDVNYLNWAMIREIDDYVRTGTWTADVETLFSNGKGDDDPETTYNEWLQTAFGDTSLKLSDAPPEALYALFYTLEALRVALGRFVRFPCDPELTTDKNGPRCLKCRIMTYPEMNCTSTNFCLDSADQENDIPHDRIGITCRYSANNHFSDQMMRILMGNSGATNLSYLDAKHYRFLQLTEFEFYDD